MFEGRDEGEGEVARMARVVSLDMGGPPARDTVDVRGAKYFRERYK